MAYINEGREFQVMPNVALERMRHPRIRVFLWGAASLRVGVTLFAVFEAPFVGRRTNLVLAWIAGMIVTGGIAGAWSIRTSLPTRPSTITAKRGFVIECK